MPQDDAADQPYMATPTHQDQSESPLHSPVHSGELEPSLQETETDQVQAPSTIVTEDLVPVNNDN